MYRGLLSLVYTGDVPSDVKLSIPCPSLETDAMLLEEQRKELI